MRFPSTTYNAAVNPARAGMIPGSGIFFSESFSKPRASGDDPGSFSIWKHGLL